MVLDITPLYSFFTASTTTVSIMIALAGYIEIRHYPPISIWFPLVPFMLSWITSLFTISVACLIGVSSDMLGVFILLLSNLFFAGIFNSIFVFARIIR